MNERIQRLAEQMSTIRTDLVGDDGKPLSWLDPISVWLKAAKKKDGPRKQTKGKSEGK